MLRGRYVPCTTYRPRFFLFTVLSLFFGLLFWAPQKVFCQNNSFKYIKNYNPKDFKLLSPLIQFILQDKGGVIYVNNVGSLLEFDGGSWRKVIKTPINTSMAIDDTGTIYVGGKNEFGYLAPDSKGELQYVSLLDHLDDNQRNFRYVWKTHSTKEGIYFETYKFLFRWDSQKIKSWKWDNRFHMTFSPLIMGCKIIPYIMFSSITFNRKG